MYNFWWVIFLQLVIFVAAVFARKVSRRRVARYLLFGLIFGLPFGIAFDLVIGKYLHVFTYTLGFTWPFLVLNGLFSYGLFTATVLVFRNVSWWRFMAATIFVAVAYEITNALHPVWHWTLPLSTVRSEAVVLFVLYPAFGAGVACLITRLRPWLPR